MVTNAPSWYDVLSALHVRLQPAAVAAGMTIPKINTKDNAVQRVVIRSRRRSFMAILILGDMVSL